MKHRYNRIWNSDTNSYDYQYVGTDAFIVNRYNGNKKGWVILWKSENIREWISTLKHAKNLLNYEMELKNE